MCPQALDKVQSQVEDYFQATRQQVFKLDDVTSSQRAAVYSQVTFTSPFPPPPSSHFSYYELVLFFSFNSLLPPSPPLIHPSSPPSPPPTHPPGVGCHGWV